MGPVGSGRRDFFEVMAWKVVVGGEKEGGLELKVSSTTSLRLRPRAR